MAKIMRFADFKSATGVEKFDFVKGKGRAFAYTPMGTLFVAGSYSDKKDAFVIEAGPDLVSKDGESLEGTLWLCNTSLKAVDIKIKGE